MKAFLTFIFSVLAIQVAKSDVIDTGRITADKIGTTKIISVRSYGVEKVEIVGLDNETEVTDVIVNTNRQRYKIYQLERDVHQGERARARVNPRDYVETIEVRAGSDLFGSRGRFKVLVHINDRLASRPRPPRYQPPRRQPPRHRRPPRRPYPPHRDYGPYPPRVEDRVYEKIKDFADDNWNGLGLFIFDAERVANQWVREGRRCGSLQQIDRMIERFEVLFERYDDQAFVMPDEARRRAIRDVRPMSPCVDILEAEL